MKLIAGFVTRISEESSPLHSAGKPSFLTTFTKQSAKIK